jgi:hypothetical protein
MAKICHVEKASLVSGGAFCISGGSFWLFTFGLAFEFLADRGPSGSFIPQCRKRLLLLI